MTHARAAGSRDDRGARCCADVVGARIVAVTVRERRLRRPIAAEFAEHLRGRRVAGIDRRGKYLLFELDDGRTLLVHLGMSGSLCLTAPSTIPLALTITSLIDLDRDRRLVFNDPRRFGLMRVGGARRARGAADRRTRPARRGADARRVAGADPRSQAADQEPADGPARSSAASATSTPTRCSSRPASARAGAPAASRRAELARLADAVRGRAGATPSRSAAARSRTTATATGSPGYFQIHHAVYDRDGQPCGQCATPIKRLVLSGRSTFYCPRCQR